MNAEEMDVPRFFLGGRWVRALHAMCFLCPSS